MPVTTIFKTLGDDSRIRIFNLLRQKRCSVGEIQSILGISQSNTSRHLEKLKTAGLVEREKIAQWIYYSIDRQFLLANSSLMSFLDQELVKEFRCQKDNLELKKYLHQQQRKEKQPTKIKPGD